MVSTYNGAITRPTSGQYYEESLLLSALPLDHPAEIFMKHALDNIEEVRGITLRIREPAVKLFCSQRFISGVACCRFL
jgi:hypothetical protein